LFARPQVVQPAVRATVHDRDSIPDARTAGRRGRRKSAGRIRLSRERRSTGVHDEPAELRRQQLLLADGPYFLGRPRRNEARIDGRETGERFTFQDFMGVGTFFGKTRRMNAEIGIKHYSNGNVFTRNASIKIPLTLTLGLAF